MDEIAVLAGKVIERLKPDKDSDPYTSGSYSCHTCGWGGYPMLKRIVELAAEVLDERHN